jgi:hypothetical protein
MEYLDNLREDFRRMNIHWKRVVEDILNHNTESKLMNTS